MEQYFQNASWIWAKDYDCPNMFLVAACPHPVPADAAGEWTLQLSVDSDFALLAESEKGTDCLCFGQYTDYDSHKVLEVRRMDAELLRGKRLYLLLTSQNCDSSTDRKERAGVTFCLSDGQGKPYWCSDAHTELYATGRHRSEDVPKVTGQLGFSFDIDLCAPLCGQRMQTQLLADMPMQLYPRPIAELVMGERVPSEPVVQHPFDEPKGLPTMAFGVRMQRSVPCAADCADGYTYIYDLDAEQVGFLTLEIDAARDTELLVGWGEHLTQGRVFTDIGGRCFAGRVRLQAGHNRLLYPLRRLGLRYLQLNAYAKENEITVQYAGVCPVDYPLPDAKPYPCHSLGGIHEEIYHACLRTLRMCLHDHYEDCPWREQALYTMDSRNQMLCGYYAYGESAAPRASLELIARSLREDALLELCAPARCPITIPAFSAMYVVQLAEYVAYTGDLEGARELIETARCVVEGFLARMDAQTALITCYPEERHWNFYEWQTGLEGSISGSVKPEDMTYDAPLCCFVSLAIRALISLLQAEGAQEAEVARLQERLEALNRAMHAAFFDEADGVYESYIRLRDGERYHRAQLTTALALLCGACPPALAPRVRERLANDTTLYPVTLSHSIFRYDALLCDDAYLPQVLGEIEQVWGGMLRAGATTFWETAQGAPAFGYAGSLCHGWSAIPLYIYWKYVEKE